ncbi:hypothetical protein DO64_4618 [Burkholderia pseudomallei]|nr:hypothetical protein DO64_4618 [Burkholderia pseudomallei]
MLILSKAFTPIGSAGVDRTREPLRREAQARRRGLA